MFKMCNIKVDYNYTLSTSSENEVNVRWTLSDRHDTLQSYQTLNTSIVGLLLIDLITRPNKEKEHWPINHTYEGMVRWTLSDNMVTMHLFQKPNKSDILLKVSKKQTCLTPTHCLCVCCKSGAISVNVSLFQITEVPLKTLL